MSSPAKRTLAPPSVATLRELAGRIEKLRSESQRLIAEAQAAVHQSRQLIAAARFDGAADQWLVRFPFESASPEGGTAPAERPTDESCPVGGALPRLD
jgi:hypothetical protein